VHSIYPEKHSRIPSGNFFIKHAYMYVYCTCILVRIHGTSIVFNSITTLLFGYLDVLDEYAHDN
jgi:hypothetical protein